jgi:ATP-dependent Clp protease protease subunit
MTGHIFIEGEIGVQVTAKTVRADIANYPNAEDFTVHFNSGGGDVYEGYQIGSILKNLGKPTTALIGAMCASIATYDALCCDHVVMNPHGDFMIHLPTGTLSGTAEDLRKGAEQLDRIKSELIDRYMTKVAKKGVTVERLSAMIDEETSMSPGEALAMGFVDEVREKLKAVASIDINKFKNDMNNETKGALEAFGAKLDAFINSLKPKNMVEIPLADGTVVMSSAETAEAVVGSTLTDEMGVPVPDGQVETADGLVLVIAGGVVASADPKVEDKTDDVQAKIQALEQENAALKEQLAQAGKSTEEAKAVTAKAVSEFKNLKDSFDELKSKTFGDQSVPQDAPDKKFDNKQEVDPLLEQMAHSLGRAFTTSRKH